MPHTLVELLDRSQTLKREMQERAQQLVELYVQMQGLSRTVEGPQRYTVRVVGNVNVRIAKALTNVVARLDHAERRLRDVRETPRKEVPSRRTRAEPAHTNDPKRAPRRAPAQAQADDWSALYGSESDEELYLHLVGQSTLQPVTPPDEDPDADE